MTGGPHSFRIGIPDSWTQYDLSGDDLARVRAGLLRTTPQKDGRDQINEAFRHARQILEGARRRGALYAAGTTTLYEDGLLMAGMMVFSVSPPAGESFSAHSLAQQFSTTGSGSRSGTSRTFSTPTLPSVGPVGRLVGVEESGLTGEAGYQLLVMHTVVPVPGSRRALIITCFSPNLPLADQLYDVFDAITATFAFEDEPNPSERTPSTG
ncbi:hypothetical protein [Streptomyces sp. NPDC001985]|uniref:hypothetical protein n=1 Tax=Streptomyces sp. NPDC001985 TaxID=3154406 RepID=UPI00332B573F